MIFEMRVKHAKHQADNLAKLRQEFLSLLELIAKIFCAVSKAINQARLSAMRNLCAIPLPRRWYLKCVQSTLNTKQTILRNCGKSFLSLLELIAKIFCAVSKAINQARLSTMRINCALSLPQRWFLLRHTRVRGTRKYIFNLVLFENKINPYIQDFAVKWRIYAQD